MNPELIISEIIAKFDDLAADRANLESNLRGIFMRDEIEFREFKFDGPSPQEQILKLQDELYRTVWKTPEIG